MSGTKRNVFVDFVFTEMTILILGIQNNRPVISSTTKMDEVTELARLVTAHACEGDELTISCTANESMHIVYANYGRLSGDICKHLWHNNLNCAANDSLSIVRHRCCGLSNCTVPARNSILGDPCHGTSKYLTVTHQCLSGILISTSPYNEFLCKPEEKGKVSWTATRPDSTTISPYPNNIDTTKAQKPCRNNDTWSSAATLQLQDKLENLSNNFSLALVHELMNDLERALTGGDKLCGFDLEALVKIMVGAINLTESNSMMNFSDACQINEVVVHITSMLLQPNNTKTWKDLPKTNQSSTATRLLWCVESSLAILAKSINETRVFKSSAPGINVLVEVSGKKSFSTPLNWVSRYDKVDDLTFIMSEGVNGLGRVTVALFDEVAQWLHVNDSAPKYPYLNSSSAAVNDSSSDATPEVIVITRVMSISIVSRSGKDAGLMEKVRYTLDHKKKKSNYSKPKCVYWKYSKETFEGHWSDEGCRDITNCFDRNCTICECDHLTNFAVLMSVSGHKMSPEHTFALEVITYIGCIISIICLALAFITFYWFKGLQCDRNTIHKNLVFCLFISEVIFLLGIGQNKHKELCAVLAGSLHYFFLASFSWMFLEGVQLYVLLVEVFETEKSRLRWYYLSGYGAPALIVSISAVATYLRDNRYAAEDYCWLSTKNGLIWAFTGPVAVIIFMNSVMLGVAIHTMCKHTSTASSLKEQHKSRIDTIGSFVRGAVALMILLGSTWTAGFLYVNEASLFMAYIFTILNSLQGLFIFVFHCLTNEKVRKEYRRCIQRCTWLPEDVRIKYGGLSGSAALSTTPNQSNSSGVPNRKRNHSLTSSPFQNSSNDKGRVLIVISSPGENELNRSLTVFACENTELTTSCKENESIHIVYANYGRIYPHGPRDHCDPNLKTNCSSNNSLSIVQRLCSGMSNCSVLASVSVFGDPCVGTLKYLKVIHRCYSVTELNRSPLTVYACEDNVLTISCEENETIHIVYANYSYIYPQESHELRNYSADSQEDRSALSTVRSLCSGKSYCSVLASNIIFGDPRVGNFKYLKVIHQCHSVNRESSTSLYNGSFCRAEQKRNVNWPDTRPVSTVNSPCPNNIYLTKAKRTCGSKALWSDVIDLSECVPKDLLELEDKLDSLTRNVSLILVRELMDGLEDRVSTGDDLYGGDLVALAKIMVGAVNLSEISNRMNFSDADKIFESVVNTTSMLLQPKNNYTWLDLPKTNQSSTATRLLWSVESSSTLRANSISEAQHFKITDPGLDVLIAVMEQTNFSTSFYIHDNKVDYLGSSDILDEARNGTGLGRVIVALFDAVGQWLHVNESATNSQDLHSYSAKCDFCSESTPDIVVNTKVMSISIVPRPAKDSRLKENVRFTMGHVEKRRTDSNPVCVSWNYSKETFEGYWSDEGCWDVSNCSDCNYTVCECNHLTNFAVLMSISGHAMSQIAEHAFVLSMMTYIGCMISIICLALAFITFYWFKGLECDRNTIHKNLVLCLFIAEIIFLLGIGQYEHKELCLVVTGFLHYFFLASFSWMFVEGVQLYILLVEVFDAANCRLRWYYISAYGVPALVVFISATTTYLQGNRYAAHDYCWLSKEGGLIWAFAGPVAVIIFLNSLVLGVVIYTMHTSSLRLKQKSKTETIGSWARSAIVLMILLGSTWIFGFLYVNEDSLFMAYIFTILNSLQGLFIFVFHCLTLEKVQKEYRRCIQRCTWLPEDVRIKYGGLNVTQYPSQNHPTESWGMPSSDYLDDPDTTTDSRKGSVDAMITHVGERA